MLGAMASGAVLGAATKSFGFWIAAKQENHKQTMELLAGKEASVQSAREYQTPGAGWARRFITIMAFSLLAFLVLYPAFNPDIISQVPVDSLWPWYEDKVYEPLHGIIAYEVLMEILVSVTSFYMGSATIGGGLK